MSFTPDDRAALLVARSVTLRVIEQIESVGIAHLQVLAAQEVGPLSQEIARRNGLCIRCGSVLPDAAVREAIAAARAVLSGR